MNAKKSLVFFIVIAIAIAVVGFGFARGATQETAGLKAAWMCGSLVVGALVTFLSFKLKK